MTNNVKINLSRGWPAWESLPTDIFKEAFTKHLPENLDGYLQYGYEAPYNEFRNTLATFLSKHYELKLNAEQLFITAGVSGAIDLICTMLTKAGDTIFIEEASYFCIFRIFTDHNLNIVKVPVDENGIIIEELEKLLQIHKPKLLYTIPTHQNPTGATIPNNRRKQLSDLSKKYEFNIVADEVYQLLSYDEVDIKPMEYFNEFNTIISVSAFTKILSPGARLGWIYASPALTERFHNSGMFFSGGNLNHTMCGVIKSIIDTGMQNAYLANLKQNLHRRMQLMITAVEQYLSPYATFLVPKGGYFIWLKTKNNINTEQLYTTAAKYGVEFMVGNKCTINGGLDNYFRLCFAYRPEAELIEGIKKIKLAFDELTAK